MNQTITISHPVDRIITLDPYTVEILVSLGVGERIVGISDSLETQKMKDLIPHAVIVGSTSAPDFELISTLHPNVVILQTSWGVDNPASTRFKSRFQMLNLTDTYFSTYGASMPASVYEMGRMTGKTQNAERYLTFYQKYDDLIHERLKNITADQMPRVYYETRARYSVAGPGSGGAYHLKELNVKNIGDQLSRGTPTVSPEWVVLQDPDVIIKTISSSSGGGTLSIDYNEIESRTGLSEISAIRNKRIYVISNSILYGPREIIGRLYLAKILYPERFADIDPDSVLQQYNKDFLSVVEGAIIYPPLKK